MLRPRLSSDFEKAEGKETPVKVRVDVLDLIVMTQSCDLENKKAPFVACCPIHSILRFEEFTPKLKQKGEWERVRQGRIEGLHLLGSTSRPEDKMGGIRGRFRSIYSLPIAYMTAHAESLGKHGGFIPLISSTSPKRLHVFSCTLDSLRIFPPTTTPLRGRRHRRLRRWRFSKTLTACRNGRHCPLFPVVGTVSPS